MAYACCPSVSSLALWQSATAHCGSDIDIDGGGVRGLSALLILKGIMQKVNEKRKNEVLPHVRPCDVFDLIGGTSTGG